MNASVVGGQALASSTSDPTRDLKVGSVVATLPGAWRWTGWPGVIVL